MPETEASESYKNDEEVGLTMPFMRLSIPRMAFIAVLLFVAIILIASAVLDFSSAASDPSQISFKSSQQSAHEPMALELGSDDALSKLLYPFLPKA